MRRRRVDLARLGTMRPSPFRLVLADPAWKFGDKLPGGGRGAQKHYDVMNVAEICAYPLPPIADDALLLLWRVSAMQQEALDVAKAWGFTPKSEIVWVKEGRGGKMHFGMGRYVRLAHEVCLVCARGKAREYILDRAVRSVFIAPVGEHSAKPQEFYEIAERLYPGPRVELFARGAPRPGWAHYGREAIGSPEAPAASVGT